MVDGPAGCRQGETLKRGRLGGRRREHRDRPDQLPVHEADRETTSKSIGHRRSPAEAQLLETVRLQRGILLRQIEFPKPENRHRAFFSVCLSLSSFLVLLRSARESCVCRSSSLGQPHFESDRFRANVSTGNSNSSFAGIIRNDEDDLDVNLEDKIDDVEERG